MSVSGPTTLAANQVGTWTASVSGGITPYSYVWAKYRNCPGPFVPAPQRVALPAGIEAVTCWLWYNAPSTTNTYSASDPYDFWVRVTVTDAVGLSTSKVVCVNIPNVIGRDPCPGSAPFAIGQSGNLEPMSLGGPLVTRFVAVRPNPARGTTTLEFSLAAATHVTLAVYDVAGREVARIVDEPLGAGAHAIVWNASGVRSGLYLSRMKAGKVVETRRFMLIQ